MKITWDESKAETRSSSELLAAFSDAAKSPGRTVAERGKMPAGDGIRTIEAEYTFPYLAHAPMEPLDCVIEADETSCSTWYGCQFPSIDQTVIAQILGLKPEQVSITTLLAGGSFGRRVTGPTHRARRRRHPRVVRHGSGRSRCTARWNGRGGRRAG